MTSFHLLALIQQAYSLRTISCWNILNWSIYAAKESLDPPRNFTNIYSFFANLAPLCLFFPPVRSQLNFKTLVLQLVSYMTFCSVLYVPLRRPWHAREREKAVTHKKGNLVVFVREREKGHRHPTHFQKRGKLPKCFSWSFTLRGFAGRTISTDWGFVYFSLIETGNSFYV